MTKVTNKNGTSFEIDEIMDEMDFELRCKVADMLQLSSDQEFFDVYAIEHFKKFGKEWECATK